MLRKLYGNRTPSLNALVRAGVTGCCGVIVQQPFARVPAVDEPEVRRWLVEAEQFLEALRKLADLAGVGAEGVPRTGGAMAARSR